MFFFQLLLRAISQNIVGFLFTLHNAIKKLCCVKPVKYYQVNLKVTKPCKVWCFLPLLAKFFMKWRFLLEPIGEFPSVVRMPKIALSLEIGNALTIRRIQIFFHWLVFFQHDFEVFVRNVFSDASSEARMVLQRFGFTRLSLMTSQSFEFWRLFQKCWLPSKIDHS